MVDVISKHTLPANAYKELLPGEEYAPVMAADKSYPEVTFWSVLWGLVMVVLFSAAAAYSGLKIGQVMETAIPIAVLAVGLSGFLHGKHTLGQNVIIQSIGANASGIVVGAIFVLPALYILNLTPRFYQMFLVLVLGGFLGILFLIPFRKYFVKEMHGKLPFPEATATTEILMAGESGGSHATVLIASGLVGGINDFVINSLGWWRDTISSRMFEWGSSLADKGKLIFKMNTTAMILGIGYIIGLRYAIVICMGSFLSWLVFIPFLHYVGQNLTVPLGATATELLSNMSAEEIFTNYVRHIGIGAIAMAGIIGIIRSWRVIWQSVQLASRGISKFKAHHYEKESRCQTDIRMPFVVLLLLLTAFLIVLFLYGGVAFSLTHALFGLGLVFMVAFLFTTVAANAIAIVGSSPVSGMTLMTLLLAALLLNWLGFSGNKGILAALLIGGIVCTALAVAGSFVTDLKVGYWLGTTPRKQETWKFLGALVSAATVLVVIYVLNQTYGFTGSQALAAPQANAMVAVIKPLMEQVAAPWPLYFIGAIIMLILVILKVPALPFALGMYLPQDLNTPLLLGGFLAWVVSSRSQNSAVNASRVQRGTLIASGFIAGGALFGVMGALVKFFGVDWFNYVWEKTTSAAWLSVAAVIMLCVYLVWETLRDNIVEPE